MRLFVAVVFLFSVLPAQEEAPRAVPPPIEALDAPPAPEPNPNASDEANFWFVTYPGAMTEFDPRTDEVVRKIPFRYGMPWDVNLAHDRNRFLIVTKQQTMIEVVDRTSGEVTEEHEFVEDDYIIRVRGVTETPRVEGQNEHWYVRIDRVKKHKDRFSFEPSEVLLYDATEKEVVKRLKKMPDELSGRVTISPDGRYWHSFSRDGNFVVLDPESLEEVAKIDLRTPRFGGAGAIRLNGTDLLQGRDPTRYRAMYTTTDPVEDDRTMWGVCEIDLVNHEIVSITEWGKSLASWGLRVSHDGRFGATMSGGGERGSRVSLFDLTDGTRVADHYQQYRPRRSLAAIAPDGSKVYVGGAGSDFEVYDAEFNRLKTVEFDGEIYGPVFVLGR
ncbi:MAG: hypothetical protein AAF196_02290 [Planctomycetota bacterium]